ncbi:Fc.00g045650.m01.CDS01 [Cosmosporella sp. VM-42]
MQDVDVTIVGGGPTGLFTALLLHCLGVSVCVLDEKPAILKAGRADALNARTQQYFEVAGILDELLPRGLKCNTSSTFSRGEFKSRQNAWWVSIEHALHKNFLMIGQPVVEEVISRKLQGVVMHHEKVNYITEDKNFVIVRTQSGCQFRSRFAVGADGARSMVRNSLGVGFVGTKPEMLWAVLDTFIETDFPVCPEIITFELGGQSRVSWIPRERGLSRFYVLLEGAVSQALAEESIKRHMAPYHVEFKQTEWYSTFNVKERIADSFISREGSGRIFLAGDAAHVHSVNGGQGLNTGISDAFALAWRLSFALRPSKLALKGNGKLLRSYDVERRSIARQVIDIAAALVRDTVHEAKQYVTTIQRNAGFITGMGVAYNGLGSQLVEGSEHGIWRAGDRCPDVILRKMPQSSPTRLYSEVQYGKFLTLFIGKRGETFPSHASGVVSYIVLPTLCSQAGSDEAEQGASDIVSTGQEFTADWASFSDPFVVIVRPDMYIGLVSSPSCERSWKVYLDGIFGSAD